MDRTGTPTHALNYDPYGVPLQPNTSTTLGFTGEQTDPLGLVNLRARTYNPRWGAFTSVDPVLGVGGSTGWNGYLYANGNPANLTDASGMCPDGYDFVSCLLYDANTTGRCQIAPISKQQR